MRLAAGRLEQCRAGSAVVFTRARAALAELASDAEVRLELGRAARAHVRERYAAERLLADVAELYDELLDARR